MPVAFYMNQHVPCAITVGLRLRGVDMITAYEDGASDMDDPALLDRAAELGVCCSLKMMTFSPKPPGDRKKAFPFRV